MTLPSPLCLARQAWRTLNFWARGAFDTTADGCNYNGEPHAGCWVLVLTCSDCGAEEILWGHGELPDGLHANCDLCPAAPVAQEEA